MHDTRAQISRFVREHPGSTPALIAEALQLKAATVRKTCTRMAEAGQLRPAPGGTYHPPEPSDSDSTPAVSQLSLSHPTAADQGEHQ